MSLLQKRSDGFNGIATGLGAHLAWGVAVLYWPLLNYLPAVTIMAQRMVWSCLAMGLALLFLGRMHEVKAAFKEKKLLMVLAASAFILCINWTTFLWAVNSGRVIETSLGYFTTPFLNALMGRIFLGERINRTQALALLLAMCGVAVSFIFYGKFPWLGLFLASSFAIYGYIRKVAHIEAVPGLFLETLFVLPFALGWIFFATPDFGGLTSHGLQGVLLCIGTVAFTGLPLSLFSYAARHLTLATVGILQYVSPSMNFLLAILFLGETIKPSDYVTFPFIWAALILYTWDALRNLRSLHAQGRH